MFWILLVSIVPFSAVGSGLQISEIVASNKSGLKDDYGETSDWIELVNSTDAVLNLDGYFLTDDPEVPKKWAFPSFQLDAGELVVVFASKRDRKVAKAGLHTNFSLSAKGEYLAVMGGDGEVVSEISPAFPPLAGDQAFGFVGGGYAILAEPSPGEENAAAALRVPLVTPAGGLFREEVTVTITGTPEGVPVELMPRAIPEVESGAGEPVESDELQITSSMKLGVAAGAARKVHYTFLKASEEVTGFTSELPVMVLVDALGSGGVTRKKIDGRLLVFEGGGGSDLSGRPAVDARARFNVRGRSSVDFPKKQLRLEVQDEEGHDRAVSIAGLPAESDWVLGAPYADESLVRNAFAYGVAEKMGLVAPRTRLIELFLDTKDGEITMEDYQGVAVLTESIKVGRERIDIPKLRASDRKEPLISGGYILRMETGARRQGVMVRRFNALEFVAPKEPNTEQQKWVDEFVWDLVKRVRRKVGYAEKMDLDSFVDTVILNEFAKDQDAFIRSTYFTIGEDSKLVSGPAWDFNTAFGNSQVEAIASPEGWVLREQNTQFHWFRYLMQDPAFVAKVKVRYGELRATVLSDEMIGGFLDETVEPLRSGAAERNFERWETLGSVTTEFQSSLYALPGEGFDGVRSEHGNPYGTWEGHVAHISEWCRLRLAWLDSEWGR